MRFKTSIACFVLACAMSGCIQDEALNSEAAIDACSGPNIQLALVDQKGKTASLYVSKSTDISNLEIKFQLADCAKITPFETENDVPPIYDFSTHQLPITDSQKLEQYQRKFNVTAENEKVQAPYIINVIKSELPTKYHFELENGTDFHELYELNINENTAEILQWASGNPGYQLTAQAKTAADYPTVQIANGGIGGGKYVKLETKSTGSFGTMVGMPLAAGNLFIGSFDRTNAVNNPMAATHFGFPFFYYPQKLEGWYKFTRGERFQQIKRDSKGDPIKNGGKFEIEYPQDKQDECDIYGVLYETDANVQFLDGETSLTSPNIIALARSGQFLPETEKWTEFSFEFKPQNGKTIDPEKLKKGIYKLAIVFSSSVEGAKFNGAIGSTLCIDEVTLTVKE